MQTAPEFNTLFVASDSDLPDFLLDGPPRSSTPPTPIYNFELQAARWLAGLAARKRNPPSPATLAAFASRAKTILQVVGPWTRLEDFKNAQMKKFIEDCAGFNWAPSTLNDHIICLKLIIASATNAEGELIFGRTWNTDFLDAPRVERDKQHRPTITREQIETLIREAVGQDKVFWALLAGTGLRIGEARSIRIHCNKDQKDQTTWDRKHAVIAVCNSLYRNEETGRTKTAAGNRIVFLHSSLNQMITEFVATEKKPAGSFLFQSRPNEPVKETTMRDRLAKRLPDADCSFHSFRRFRNTHLISSRVLSGIVKNQMGHSKGQDMSEVYNHQDESFIRAEIERVSLGFEVPAALAPEQEVQP